MAISGNIPNAMGHLLRSLSMGVGGIMVSIAAFQAVDPGSIPGRRIFFLETIEAQFDVQGTRTQASTGKASIADHQTISNDLI